MTGVCVVGPGFDSTSPAFVRRRVSHLYISLIRYVLWFLLKLIRLHITYYGLEQWFPNRGPRSPVRRGFIGSREVAAVENLKSRLFTQ